MHRNHKERIRSVLEFVDCLYLSIYYNALHIYTKANELLQSRFEWNYKRRSFIPIPLLSLYRVQYTKENTKQMALWLYNGELLRSVRWTRLFRTRNVMCAVYMRFHLYCKIAKMKIFFTKNYSDQLIFMRISITSCRVLFIVLLSTTHISTTNIHILWWTIFILHNSGRQGTFYYFMQCI